MLRLSLILHLFIGSTLAGVAVIVALVSGFDTMRGILIAAVMGYLVGYPVSAYVAKELYSRGS
ncbi:CTP synthetase [Shimia haliotis]|uniref:CTP synthetase n=1 Tax=Shimia haliotis TaxID=1280847 RepID=A0A1I4GYY0_9RHOB|nr:CTP synthetase [Shimia haliotis]SFL35169.1 hypothetical protein SAMN04488036_11080 [Shimia haliotis]